MDLFIALILPLFVFFFLFLFKYIYSDIWFPLKVKRHFSKQGINGPKHCPIYGNSPEFSRLFAETLNKPMPFGHDILHRADPFCHKWFDRCGKTFMFSHGSIPRLALSEPEMIKDVMLNKPGYILKAKMPPLARQLFGKGLIVLEGEKWAFHRKITNRAFVMERIKGWVPEVVDCTAKMLKNWEDERGERNEFQIDIHKEFHKHSADILSRTLFGSSFEEGKKVFELQEQQSMLTMKALREVYIPGLRYLPTRDNRLRWKIQNETRRMIRVLIDKESKTMGNSKTLLSLLRPEDEGDGLPIDEVIDECETFYFAGKEAVGNFLSWAFILLAFHQEWQKKARDEVFQLLKENELLSADHLNDLKIVTMILNETLRLYPPIPALFREATKNIKLGNLDVPAGTQICLVVAAVHHDTDIWGEDANEFNPERFSKPRKHLASYFPFGLGARNCIGQNLAMAEAKVILSMILKKYTFKLSPSYVHAPVTYLTFQPQFGAQIIFRRISC